MARRCLGVVPVLVAILILPNPSRAQSVDAISLKFDPSVRSAGMGEASSAVFWGGDANDWANPALLGYHRGLRYSFSRTQLIPDLADDIYFTATRLTAGACGVGLSFAGLPGQLGGATLDYGTFGSPGEPTIPSREDIQSFGVGANLVEFFESVSGRAPRWSRYGDVSLGWARKDVRMPGGVTVIEVRTYDIGLLVRATPLGNSGSDHEVLPNWGGLRADLSFALSSRSHGDAFVDVDPADAIPPLPILRENEMAFAARVATGFPPAWRQQFENRGCGWLAEAFTPLFSFGVAWEHSTPSIPQGTDREDLESIDLWGGELTVANVIALRAGYVDDAAGGIQGGSWGLGLGFQVGEFAGVRYDHATAPQADGLTGLRREGVTAFVDVDALVHTIRAAPASNP